jgi:radical SAM-linked protein
MEEVSALKIRIKFAKHGTMKFIGHLDIMRYFQKVMRKAEVNICYSGGFSPHQIMSFASPLGVGLTSDGEYVDIEVSSTDSSKEMLRRINEVMVEGLEALSYRLLPETAANAMSCVAAADYTVVFREGKEPADWARFCDGLKDFLAQDEILMTKKSKKGEREVDIRPMIYELGVEDDKIRMKIASGSAANLKPEMVIQAYMQYLNLELEEFALLINRDEVYANASKEEGKTDLRPLSEFGEDIE